MEKIRIYCHNVLYRKNDEYTEQVGSLEQKLFSICHPASVTNIFPRYYPYDETYMHEDRFPYIIRNGVYEWNVPIASVTIREFLNTFPSCTSEGIYIETGVSAAGGRDYCFGKKAWDLCAQLVSYRYPEVGWTAELLCKLKDFIESFSGSDIQNKTEPHILLAIASNKYGAFRGKEFSPREVAELLNIEDYRAEKVLKNIGFRRHSETGKYYLLEDDRQKCWELAMKVAEYEYDSILRYESGSTEYTL